MGKTRISLLGLLSAIAYPETFSTPDLPNVTCQEDRSR